MSKHTSGPWKVQQVEYGFAVTDQEGYEISPTRNISDARLIAAAPEMLAALEAVLAVASQSAGIAGWHSNGDLAGWGELLPEVGEAIVKAKGGKA